MAAGPATPTGCDGSTRRPSHLTLAFLGSVEPDGLGSDRRRRSRGGRASMRRWPVPPAGSAPSRGRAAPGWCGTRWTIQTGRSRPSPTDLHDALELVRTEPYRPHVTLARARRRSVDLRGWIEAASADGAGRHVGGRVTCTSSAATSAGDLPDMRRWHRSRSEGVPHDRSSRRATAPLRRRDRRR